MEFYNSKHAGREMFDEVGEQEIYEYIFQPTFRESANINRSVYFTSYLVWAGKVRELALDEIGQQLADQISTAEWGLVTNWADLEIVNEVYSFERILAKFRIGKVVGSIIPLRCEFFKLVENSDPVPLAIVSQETTWVEVIGHGKVKPAPFPGYLQKYLDRTRQKVEFPDDTKCFKGVFSDIKTTEILYRSPPLISGFPVAAEDSFSTTLEDSNLVGNVYYANYFIWQGRVRDKFLNDIAPEYLRGSGDDGILVCVSSRLNYLRDAMPFDKIYVTLSINELYERKASLKFEYFRLLDDGKKEKLAVGNQVIAWIINDEINNSYLSDFPKKIMNGFFDNLKLNERKLSA